jgi:hypothetical protein
LVTVKDSGFLGNGIFLGEALLPMDEIPVTDMDTYLRDLPQIQLPLTKPSGYGDYKFLKTVKAAECNHTETNMTRVKISLTVNFGILNNSCIV